MEKAKVTAKWIKESFGKRLSVGYCSMQFLLKYKEPEYYTCGGSGWNSDNYYFHKYDLLISTGYNPVSGTIKTDCNLIDKYEKQARAVIESPCSDFNSRERKAFSVSQLLDKFLQEVTK
jgi:hypothetical protein